jgi:hypothetical protein
VTYDKRILKLTAAGTVQDFHPIPILILSIPKNKTETKIQRKGMNLIVTLIIFNLNKLNQLKGFGGFDILSVFNF